MVYIIILPPIFCTTILWEVSWTEREWLAKSHPIIFLFRRTYFFQAKTEIHWKIGVSGNKNFRLTLIFIQETWSRLRVDNLHFWGTGWRPVSSSASDNWVRPRFSSVPRPPNLWMEYLTVLYKVVLSPLKGLQYYNFCMHFLAQNSRKLCYWYLAIIVEKWFRVLQRNILAMQATGFIDRL